jgi:hypothetical protein
VQNSLAQSYRPFLQFYGSDYGAVFNTSFAARTFATHHTGTASTTRNTAGLNWSITKRINSMCNVIFARLSSLLASRFARGDATAWKATLAGSAGSDTRALDFIDIKRLKEPSCSHPF